MDEIKIKTELDPDYNELPERPLKRIKLESGEGTIKNYERIVQVFQREFQKEIFAKREEVHKIQQQLLKAQKTLHLLKYVVVKSFYESKEVKLMNTNEVPVLQSTSTGSNLIESVINSQHPIHPAVKKLIGKRPINYEPYRTRKKSLLNPYANKNIIRRGENITIKEDDGVDNIKSEPIEEERTFIDTSKIKTEIKKEEEPMFPIRNRNKNKYSILVGNISKWMPSNNSQDNSTHKWMVYVRGPKENPDISHIVKKVRFFLHPSYQPNDIVDVQEAPFHLSRRGWGEFPLRVQIHFKVSKNKPIDIIHNIKLDRTYTGRQTMGQETLVNVWIYDNDFEESETESKKIQFDIEQIYIKKECSYEDVIEDKKLEYIKKDLENVSNISEIPVEKCSVDNCDKLTDFISNCEESLKVLQDIEDNNKAIYEETPKPQLLSLESISQPDDYIEKNEQILNGLLKNNIFDNQESVLTSIGVTDIDLNISQETISTEQTVARDLELICLEDHCYTKLKEPTEKINQITKPPKYAVGKSNWTTLDANYIIEKDKYKVEVPLECFKTISQIVYFFFKNLPLVIEHAKETGYMCSYPYAAATLEEFQSWNTTKQFCSEVL